MNKQAFNQGFIKKCAQYGITDSRQVNYLYKQALNSYVIPTAAGTLLGAGAGAGIAHGLGKDLLTGAAIGGLTGGVAGASGNALYNYMTVDPIDQLVEQENAKRLLAQEMYATAERKAMLEAMRLQAEADLEIDKEFRAGYSNDWKTKPDGGYVPPAEIDAAFNYFSKK